MTTPDTDTLPPLPADVLALDEAYPGMALAEQVRDYGAQCAAAERERLAPLVRAAGRALQAFDDGDLQPAPDTVQGRLAVDALREAWGAFVPSRIRSPRHPTPAKPAPLWAPEGLVAHDDDPSEDRCLKCCFVDDADSCVQTPCEASAPSGYRPHLSGRPVYFTRKP